MKKLLALLLLLPTLAFAQQSIPQGGTGWSTSTKGDLLVGTSSTLRYTRLPIGSTGNVLWVNNGQPAWVATSSLGFSSTNLLPLNNTWTGANTFSSTTAQTLFKGYVGIGASPDTSAILDVHQVGNTVPMIQAQDAGTQGASSGGIIQVTMDNGAAIASSTRLGSFQFSGDNGDSIKRIGAAINAIATELWSSSNQGTQLKLNVTQNGATTRTTALTLNQDLDALFSGRIVTPSLYLTGKFNDSTNASGTLGQVLQATGTSTRWVSTSSLGLPSGTVTAVSVATANGFAGSSSGGATPALTISTTANGVLVGNGTSIAATTTTGTGNVVLSAGPTLSGVVTLPTASNIRIATDNAKSLFLSAGILGTINSGAGNQILGIDSGNTSPEYKTFAGANNVSITNRTGSMTFDLTGGVAGKTPYWASSTGMAIGTLFQNGTVAGMNATSSTVSFNVQGTTSLNPFNVASSTGTTLFHVANTGNIGFGTSTFSSTFAGRVTIDALTASTTEGHTILGNLNNFFEDQVVNFSAGAGAQACQTATNNLGSITTGFISLCANSSAFNNPTVFNTGGAGDTSVMGYSTGDFILANATATRSMLFVTGGSATTTNTRMSINGGGQVSIATTTTPTYGFTVATTTQFTAGVISRVIGYASAASTTINLNTTDIATTTINQTTTLVNPVGTYYDGQMVEYRLKATTTQTIFWGTNFASSTDLQYPTTVASGTTRVLWEYRQDAGKLELVGLLKTFLN